jgi:class 3 adenylate cyclase
MRTGESTIADSFEEVTILFADVVGFTRLAAARPADQIVRLLNRIFTAFDELADRWDVEKIKTIGDAYMVASGLPLARDDHAAVVAEVALAMREAARRIADEQGLVLELRIGVHTGPVVAGIIGLKKFAYDVWGDTVNVASRMEASAPAGSIQVSERTARRLESLYTLSSCAPVTLRGLGPVTTYLLEGRKPELEEDAFPHGRVTRSNVVAIAGTWSRLAEKGRVI